MQSARLTPKRYQLNKEAAQVALRGHPWIFRSKVSSAASIFKSGQLLKLFDTENQPIGQGLYDEEGLIAIRVFRFPELSPAALRRAVDRALAKRENLRKYTNAFRAIHGENDGLPGVVVDVYGEVGVLQTYSAGVDVVGRYVGNYLADSLNLKTLVWKIPAKRRGQPKGNPVRLLRGTPPGAIQFREGRLDCWVEPFEGQKSGTFLDLRGLRKWVSSQNLNGKRVLNLFSYTGTLGLAAEIAGAKEIWNVDIAEGALQTAKKYHAKNPKKHRFITADAFDYLSTLAFEEKFDLIIADPPAMASQSTQVPGALKAYRRLFSSAVPHLARGGILVGGCCTSRITRNQYIREMDKTIGGRLKRIADLPPEDDHPVGFEQGDYLKILIYR